MRREEILIELEKTRVAMARNMGYLQQDLDIGARVRENIAQNAGLWVLGATVTGFLLSKRRPAASKSSRRHKGEKGAAQETLPEVAKTATTLSLITAGVRMAMPVLKPIVTAYAAKGLAQIASRFGK